MIRQNIYIAATDQHVGKTTSTLGLVAAFKDYGIGKIGYCKPVGQEIKELFNQHVDKDAFLFSEIMHFTLFPEVHSPVILGTGATTDFLDNPDAYDFKNRIVAAAEKLNKWYDLVVYEGTGHPGVGSVVNLSNATVAKLLDASVVMVVEGGIGRTIDRLNLSLALFREQNVPVVGVIVNKVIPEKMDKIRYYLEKKLNKMGVPLLGLLPYEKRMSNPIMRTVSRAVDGKFILNENKNANSVDGIIAGSLLDEKDKIQEGENLLLVASSKRIDETTEMLSQILGQKDWDQFPISGAILTGEEVKNVDFKFFKEHEIPVITTDLDTLGAVMKIDHIEVKINTNTPWKVARAMELIKENVNLDLIFKKNAV